MAVFHTSGYVIAPDDSLRPAMHLESIRISADDSLESIRISPGLIGPGRKGIGIMNQFLVSVIKMDDEGKPESYLVEPKFVLSKDGSTAQQTAILDNAVTINDHGGIGSVAVVAVPFG